MHLLTELVHNLTAHNITNNYVFWTSSRERSGGKRNLECWWRSGDTIWNIKKPLGGGDYDMAYFVQHFIAGARQIISQFVCNGSAKISAFVVICGGGWGCWRRQYSECLSYRPCTLGCVGSLLSLVLSQPNLHRTSLQGPRSTILADTLTQYLVFLHSLFRASL